MMLYKLDFESLRTFGGPPVELRDAVSACLDFRPRYEAAMSLLPSRRVCHVMAPLVAEALTQMGFEAHVEAVESRVVSRGRATRRDPGYVFWLGEYDEHPDNFHVVVRVGDWLIDPTVGQLAESVRVAFPSWRRIDDRKYLSDLPDWLIARANTELALKRIVLSYQPRLERQQAWQVHTAACLPTEVRDRLAAMAVTRAAEAAISLPLSSDNRRHEMEAVINA